MSFKKQRKNLEGTLKKYFKEDFKSVEFINNKRSFDVAVYTTIEDGDKAYKLGRGLEILLGMIPMMMVDSPVLWDEQNDNRFIFGVKFA